MPGPSRAPGPRPHWLQAARPAPARGQPPPAGPGRRRSGAVAFWYRHLGRCKFAPFRCAAMSDSSPDKRIWKEGLVEKIFEEHKNSSNKIAQYENLIAALRAMKVNATDERSLLTDFRTVSFDVQSGLDFDEFKGYAACRRTLLEEYVRTIPVWTIISDSVSAKLDLHSESEIGALKRMASMNSEDICCIIESISEPLKKMIETYCNELSQILKSDHVTASETDKFASQFSSEDGLAPFPFEHNLSERVGESVHITFTTQY